MPRARPGRQPARHGRVGFGPLLLGLRRHDARAAAVPAHRRAAGRIPGSLALLLPKLRPRGGGGIVQPAGHPRPRRAQARHDDEGRHVHPRHATHARTRRGVHGCGVAPIGARDAGDGVGGRDCEAVGRGGRRRAWQRRLLPQRPERPAGGLRAARRQGRQDALHRRLVGPRWQCDPVGRPRRLDPALGDARQAVPARAVGDARHAALRVHRRHQQADVGGARGPRGGRGHLEPRLAEGRCHVRLPLDGWMPQAVGHEAARRAARRVGRFACAAADDGVRLLARRVGGGHGHVRQARLGGQADARLLLDAHAEPDRDAGGGRRKRGSSAVAPAAQPDRDRKRRRQGVHAVRPDRLRERRPLLLRQGGAQAWDALLLGGGVLKGDADHHAARAANVPRGKRRPPQEAPEGPRGPAQVAQAGAGADRSGPQRQAQRRLPAGAARDHVWRHVRPHRHKGQDRRLQERGPARGAAQVRKDRRGAAAVRHARLLSQPADRRRPDGGHVPQVRKDGRAGGGGRGRGLRARSLCLAVRGVPCPALPNKVRYCKVTTSPHSLVPWEPTLARVK
mmetsp:Transcript_35360/g.118203  ORF Transcript_35360/g.118203 Transcript_35360/m.118203 type:complete len:565 (+) Transcript_35360:464-2158(+)